MDDEDLRELTPIKEEDEDENVKEKYKDAQKVTYSFHTLFI
jgi:hypothetical protein